MAGFSPKLPLVLDEEDGYKLNKTIPEMVQQNLKMLVLTVPGERMMDPHFGVGLKTFLFEPNIGASLGEISSRIKNQVDIYMSFIEITDLDISNNEDEPSFDQNYVSIKLKYRIKPLELFDELEITEIQN